MRRGKTCLSMLYTLLSAWPLSFCSMCIPLVLQLTPYHLQAALPSIKAPWRHVDHPFIEQD